MDAVKNKCTPDHLISVIQLVGVVRVRVQIIVAQSPRWGLVSILTRRPHPLTLYDHNLQYMIIAGGIQNMKITNIGHMQCMVCHQRATSWQSSDNAFLMQSKQILKLARQQLWIFWHNAASVCVLYDRRDQRKCSGTSYSETSRATLNLFWPDILSPLWQILHWVSGESPIRYCNTPPNSKTNKKWGTEASSHLSPIPGKPYIWKGTTKTKQSTPLFLPPHYQSACGGQPLLFWR